MLFDDGLLTGDAFDDTGLYRVWPASISLCRHLEINPTLIHGKRVLELGAGSGLPSTLCAQYLSAARVIATDGNAAAVKLLSHALHGISPERATAAVLSWDDPDDLIALVAAESVDTLLMADVAYPSKDNSPLLDALRRTLHAYPSLCVYCASTCRDPQMHRAFEAALRELVPASSRLALLATDDRDADPLYGAAPVHVYCIGDVGDGIGSMHDVASSCTPADSPLSRADDDTSGDASAATPTATAAARPPPFGATSWRLAAAQLRLWPDAPPAGVRPYHHGWVHVGNERMLRMLIGRCRPRGIVELGSWLGLCTALLLELSSSASPSASAPQPGSATTTPVPSAAPTTATLPGASPPAVPVFAIDRWDESFLVREQHAQYVGDPEALGIVRGAGGVDGGPVPLYETFLVNSWGSRHRLFPLRMDTCAGLELVASLRAPIDLIYVDADHTEEGVLRDLRAATRLFPDAILCGDDWQWPGVRRAVARHAAEFGGAAAGDGCPSWAVRSDPGENWWWLERREVEPPSSAEGG